MVAPLPDRNRLRILARGVDARSRTRLGSLKPKGLPFPYSAPSVPGSVEELPATAALGANYDTDWARTPAARAARGAIVDTVLRAGIVGVARPQVHGSDRLTSLGKRQPAVFVANHHSHLDTSLLLTTIPAPWRHRLVVAAAADYFFDTRVKAAVSALAIGAIPIERSKVGRGSADLAAELIDEGNSVLIFPEGGRSPDGWGQPFKGGAAYLSLRCEVPVVPIYLRGTGRIWPKGKRVPKPGTTTVVFGDPMWPLPGEKSCRFNQRIESSVASLGDELSTDWWQARKRFYQSDAPKMTGPEASSWRRAWALDKPKPQKSSDWPKR